ncbi:MAG: energy transducer TonB [Prevotella sp.]|nr:energy transducer TonB [Prevotella sp.]
MAKIDLIDNSWVDLVFEGKNQAYGAYQLRKNTGKRNMWSIVIMLIIAALIAAAVGANAIISAANEDDAEIAADVNLSALAEKKAEVEEKAPVKVEEAKPVEQVKSSVKFVPPVVKEDDKVNEEKQLKTQEELNESKTAIGGFDVKGNTDDADAHTLKAVEEVEQPKEKPKEDKVFDVVEQQPTFSEGNPAAWLAKHMQYPVQAAENGIQGRVTVGFVVEKNGSISNVRVLRGVDPSLDKEAVRVVKSMPKWNPGMQNGEPVRVNYTVPVNFKLQ